MKAAMTLLATLIFAGHLIPVDAKDSRPLTSCVVLSDAHQGTRVGNQYLLLKDGDSHYRVGFGGHCDALMRSSVVQVSTDKQNNHLCAQGSSVSSRNAKCTVRTVEHIDADEYARHARRNRR